MVAAVSIPGKLERYAAIDEIMDRVTAQYDEKAKNLLGHKIILAHILVKTIDEFKGMNPKDVVQYIEGEPYISTVPVDTGSTNVEKLKTSVQLLEENDFSPEIHKFSHHCITLIHRFFNFPENLLEIGFTASETCCSKQKDLLVFQTL